MNENTTDNLLSNADPKTILCRVIDVEAALAKSFQRFVEEQKGSLEELVDLARQELSKMELFVSAPNDTTSDE